MIPLCFFGGLPLFFTLLLLLDSRTRNVFVRCMYPMVIILLASATTSVSCIGLLLPFQGNETQKVVFWESEHGS